MIFLIKPHLFTSFFFLSYSCKAESGNKRRKGYWRPWDPTLLQEKLYHLLVIKNHNPWQWVFVSFVENGNICHSERVTNHWTMHDTYPWLRRFTVLICLILFTNHLLLPTNIQWWRASLDETSGSVKIVYRELRSNNGLFSANKLSVYIYIYIS